MTPSHVYLARLREEEAARNRLAEKYAYTGTIYGARIVYSEVLLKHQALREMVEASTQEGPE